MSQTTQLKSARASSTQGINGWNQGAVDRAPGFGLLCVYTGKEVVG